MPSTPPLHKVPPLHPKPAFNEIYIKGSRPLAVYVKHAKKSLLKSDTIIIHALTSAINKAVQLCLHLMDEYPYLQQQVYTDSVPTLNIKNEGKEKQTQNEEKNKEESLHSKIPEGEEEYIVKERSAIHIVLKKSLSKS